MIADLSAFANQATTLTDEDVQALADSASAKPMLPGIHEAHVVAVPGDSIKLCDAPNAHILKFNMKFENVSGEQASVYCELSLDSSKMYRINKEGEEDRRSLGRHVKTLLALGVPPGKLPALIARVIATNGEALQGLKGFKAKLKVSRNPAKARLDYDGETGAYFIVNNKDDSRMFDEPFALLPGKGKERYAEIEIRVREAGSSLETMAQVEVQALVETENPIAQVLSFGKVANKVVVDGKAVATAGPATVKAGALGKVTPAVAAKPAPNVLAKPIVKPVAKPAPVVTEETALPEESELTDEDVAEDAADYDAPTE